MNLYLVSRTDLVGYDEYDSAVMAAEGPDDAIKMSPVSNYFGLTVELIGWATDRTDSGVVLASFNAG